MAKATRLPTKPTEAPPSLAKRFRACAEHLETFAGTVPLVFTFREGEDLHCSVGRVGNQAPEAYTCLDHFYAAIKEIDSAIVDLGLRGPDGQSPPPMTVMNWADWPHLQRGATPSHKRLFSLGKSLVGWWISNRRQGNYRDGPYRHCHYVAINGDSAAFARSAAVEALAIAALAPNDAQSRPLDSPPSPSAIRPPPPPPAVSAVDVNRLSKHARTIIRAMFDRGATNDSKLSPSQKKISEWINLPLNTTLKTTLSSLVHGEWLGNHKHSGGRGGYYLARRALEAAEILRRS